MMVRFFYVFLLYPEASQNCQMRKMMSILGNWGTPFTPIIGNGSRSADLNKQKLPTCHCALQLNSNTKNKLDVT
jgi:hypothetical protein